MATKVIDASRLRDLAVLIVTRDEVYAQRMSACMKSIGTGRAQHADSLETAMSALHKEDIDIIVAEIHVDRGDGLILPCMVSEMNLAGQLKRIPHIVLTAEDCAGSSPLTAGVEQGWGETLNGVSIMALRSHARLAKTAGIHVEILRDSSADYLSETFDRLSNVRHLPPHVQCTEGSNVPAEEDVVMALTSGEGLRVVYQPQYNLLTKKVVGAEALIRWRHPLYGDVSPAVLIPMVNQLGLDLLLFSFIEKSVFQTLLSLNNAGIEIPIAVNASAKTICAPGLASRLATKMQTAGLPAQRLKIELTEDMVPDSELSLSASITALRSKGFPVSLDDFGAGAATLALLSRMPFDEMKIDGALVRAVAQTPASRELISGVVALAKMFNLKLVTEGIEDETTIALLTQLGCEVGQGYALARPMEVDDFMNITIPTLRP